jgi:hypothetical protein
VRRATPRSPTARDTRSEGLCGCGKVGGGRRAGGGGVACAHTPNIASQPSAHHCLKSITKTNTNQYIGQIRPLENHKAHKSDKAPKFRLGLPERSPIDLSGRPSRNFGALSLHTDFGQNVVFLGPWNCHTLQGGPTYGEKIYCSEISDVQACLAKTMGNVRRRFPSEFETNSWNRKGRLILFFAEDNGRQR